MTDEEISFANSWLWVLIKNVSQSLIIKPDMNLPAIENTFVCIANIDTPDLTAIVSSYIYIYRESISSNFWISFGDWLWK